MRNFSTAQSRVLEKQAAFTQSVTLYNNSLIYSFNGMFMLLFSNTDSDVRLKVNERFYDFIVIFW